MNSSTSSRGPPAFDRFLLDRLGGSGLLDRLAAAGVPLRRQFGGGIALGNVDAYRSSTVDPAGAARLATELNERNQPIEAISLLVDAGAHDRAIRMLVDLPESVVDTVEPARPDRFCWRAWVRPSTPSRRCCSCGPRPPSAAVVSIFPRPTSTRRWPRSAPTTAGCGAACSVEYAERLWIDGQLEGAEKAARDALADLGPGEDRTLASAHVVLAQVAASSDHRDDLQARPEEYRLAIRRGRVAASEPGLDVTGWGWR